MPEDPRRRHEKGERKLKERLAEDGTGREGNGLTLAFGGGGSGGDESGMEFRSPGGREEEERDVEICPAGGG